jgi:hypothetical protein
MTLLLRGYVGQSGGNETSLRVVLPIVETEEHQLLVATTLGWTQTDGVRVREPDEVVRFGTELPEVNTAVREGELLLIAGPVFRLDLEAIGGPQLDGWAELPDGSGSSYVVVSVDDARSTMNSVDELAVDTFWSGLQDVLETGDALTETLAALALISSSETLPREEFYIASLAATEVLPDAVRHSAAELMAVAEAEMGASAQIVERNTRLRLRQRSGPPADRVSSDDGAPAPVRALERLTLSQLMGAPSPALFRALAAGLGTSRIRGQAFPFDLQESSPGGRGRAVDATTVMMVSDLLLGEFRDVPIAYTLPPDPRRLQLARGGLLFALAQGRPDDEDLVSWLEPWHPTSHLYRQALLRYEDNDSVARLPSVEADMLTLVNPHRHGASEDQATIITNYVESWLYRRSRALGDPHEASPAAGVYAAGEVVRQLFLNIREYAALDRDDTDPRGSTSLIQVFFTRGGGLRGANRLYLLVLDTGVGLPARVRELQGDPDLPATKTVVGVLDGTFRRHRPNRGWGLHDIYEACLGPGPAEGPLARMTIIAGDTRDGQCVFSSNTAEHGVENIFAASWPIPYKGTSVLVELPLIARPVRNPEFRRDPAEHQLRLV